MFDRDEVISRFDHSAPSEDEIEKIVALRSWYKDTVQAILTLCPPGRNQSLAITALEESCHWAVKALVKD